MQRIELTGTAQPNFIGCWNLENPALCDGIVEFFEQHPVRQRPGESGAGVNAAIKNSVDINVNPADLEAGSHAVLASYMQALHACFQDYQAQWPFLAGMLKVADIGDFNIQRYLPGGHFSAVHSERTTLGSAHRVLAWMTYLNDVDDGGQTRFTHYGLDVKPERGKTLIWPAEWTHAHAGAVVAAGKKYVITGWMHFPPAIKPPVASP